MNPHYTIITRNKYNAKRTDFGGRYYDSKLEAGLASDIELMRKAGEVTKVEPQKTFYLYGKNGSKICGHRVDFLLTFKDTHQEVWEAKGIEFPLWRLKVKLFTDNYPDIEYLVVKAKKWYKFK